MLGDRWLGPLAWGAGSEAGLQGRELPSFPEACTLDPVDLRVAGCTCVHL